jgi:transcriptional regulator with XRE-family HTH domain
MLPWKSLYGEQLRRLREEQGWSLSDLAERSGVNRMAIWKMEQGERLPSWESAVVLAKALGVTLNDFEPGEFPANGER